MHYSYRYLIVAFVAVIGLLAVGLLYKNYASKHYHHRYDHLDFNLTELEIFVESRIVDINVAEEMGSHDVEIPAVEFRRGKWDGNTYSILLLNNTNVSDWCRMRDDAVLSVGIMSVGFDGKSRIFYVVTANGVWRIDGIDARQPMIIQEINRRRGQIGKCSAQEMGVEGFVSEDPLKFLRLGWISHEKVMDVIQYRRGLKNSAQ